MNQERQMLIRCRDQFEAYAMSHREKALKFAALAEGSARAADATAKADVNENLVQDIEQLLNQPEHMGPLGATANFAKIAYADGVSPKNQQTQLGVHFEEVAEMIQAIDSGDVLTRTMLRDAEATLENLGHHLKDGEAGLIYILPEARLDFLDAVCDQLVTATLSAVLHDMDPVGGLNEVNRSNYSKLVNGVMTKDPVTAKWIKGPDYTVPDLKPFI